MIFEKPDLAALRNESDVEQNFLFPLLVGDEPSGLGHEPSTVHTKPNIRKFDIGKGSDQKRYFPDYVVTIGMVPLLVAEGKGSGEDLIEAFREARLYAAELNAMYPSGLNPLSKIIACNGARLLGGYADQKEPVFDISYDEIAPYSNQMALFGEQFGASALQKTYSALLPRIRPKRFWKPTRLVGGMAIQKEQVPINSFGATISTDFSHIFSPITHEDRTYIAQNAYVSSKRRERYIEPIDKVIRAATPPSISQSRTIEDTKLPNEIIKPFRETQALENKVLLLIGSAGAGKTTFVDYLQEVALPAEVRAKTLWIRIDMNPAPISREEIYDWLRKEIIRGCRNANPSIDFDTLENIKSIHSVEVNEFRKGIGRLYEKNKDLYDQKLGDHLTTIMNDSHAVAKNISRYCSTQRGRLLVLVLDNCDKRLRDEQLLMFESAQWLQREFRGLVVLPLREETYDNHRSEPPLDTALKDLVFRIEPPLFQKILMTRVQLALRSLARKGGQRLLQYTLPNGMKVEYPASEQAFYLSSILRSIFEHDLHIRRLIVGLAGRNMRRAMEIFLEFCTSGHIGADEITKIRLSQGQHILPLGLVTSVLLRLNQRFYESDASYLKNLYAAEERDSRPNFFSRVLILRWLQRRLDSPGLERLKGYAPVGEVRAAMSKFGIEGDVFWRELEYLAKGFCVVSEDFRTSGLEDEMLIALSPAGLVHLHITSHQYYLAAVAEDTWFDNEATAARISSRIKEPQKQYQQGTVLENATDMLQFLNEIRKREAAAFRSVFDNDSFESFTDLSAAWSALGKFEIEVVSNEWIGVHKRYRVGTVHEGKINNVTKFGIFVDLEPNVAGLVHSSNLFEKFEQEPKLARGEKVQVEILDCDRVQKRFNLALAKRPVRATR